MIEEKLYSYSELSRTIGVGTRQTWRNLILHQDFKHYFTVAGSNFGRDLYSTNLSKKELKNLFIEYKKKVQFIALSKATKTRLSKINLTKMSN